MGIIEVIDYAQDKRGENGKKEMPQLVQKMMRVANISQEIARHQESIEQIDTQRYHCTSNLTGMPRGGQKQTHEDVIQRLNDLRQIVTKLERDKAQLIYEISIDDDTKLLTTDEYRALSRRYLNGLSVRAAAKELYMSSGMVYNLTCRALNKLREKNDYEHL